MVIKYDNCKNCHSLCIHAGKDREFVCINGVSCKITMEKPLDTKIYGGKGRMKFKDFEIRPTCFIDGHTDPKKWDVVKWQCHNPIEVTDLETGEKRFPLVLAIRLRRFGGMTKNLAGSLKALAQGFWKIIKKVCASSF